MSHKQPGTVEEWKIKKSRIRTGFKSCYSRVSKVTLLNYKKTEVLILIYS